MAFSQLTCRGPCRFRLNPIFSKPKQDALFQEGLSEMGSKIVKTFVNKSEGSIDKVHVFSVSFLTKLNSAGYW